MCAALSAGSGVAMILVCAPDDDTWALEALRAGARGLLTKTTRAETLIEAIRIVNQGLMWVPWRLLVRSFDCLVATASDALPAEALLQHLSPREREVFRLAATGAGNKELAERLAISEATVKVHLTRIFQKLGLHRRAELAAAYHGLRSNASCQERPAALRPTA